MHIEEWHDYSVALAGALAALAGLLFVALSINIERIIKMPWLPPRAATTMLLLVGSLLEALVALWPHPSAFGLGISETAIALGVWGYTVQVLFTAPKTPTEFARFNVQSIVMVQIAALPALGGGIALLCGLEAGMFAIAFSALAAIVVAFMNSWVLLVEILR